MRSNGYKCYNSDCKYYWGEMCRASADVTLTCIGRIAHKKTNADHIRSMTDEELAEYLYDRVGIAAEHIAYCENNPECELMLEADICIPDAMCRECLCRWLKKPYKEQS